MVNASISPELPYESRQIIVTLGSESKSQTPDPSIEFVEFEFDLVDRLPKDYPLSVTFTAVDEIPSIGQQTIMTTKNETVRANTGNKQLFCDSFFLVFLTMLILLCFNR